MTHLSTHSVASDEASFHLFVDSVKDYAIFMLSPSGHVTTWNNGAEHIKGYTAREIIGRHFSCFYTPEDIAIGKPRTVLETAIREGRFEEEGWRIRKDGTRFWARVTVTALFNPEGVLTGFGKVTRDLTEQKRSENALLAANSQLEARVQERSAQWRALFENGPVGMTKISLSGQFLEVNPAFCSLVGYSAEALKQMTFRDLGPAEDIEDALPYMERLIAGEISAYTREKVFIRRDGTQIHVESSLSLVCDPNGTPLYFIGIGTEITERKRAEAARRESEIAYRSIFEQAAVGIAHADLPGRIIRVNQKYGEIVGYQPEEIVGKQVREIAHPDDRAEHMRLRGRLLAGEIPNFTMEKRLVRKDGTIAWISLNVSLGHDPVSGQPTHTIAVVEDITAQKQAEQALNESQQRLALAVEASGLGTWEMDLQTQTLWLSANKALMLGYGQAEQQMPIADFLKQVHPDDRPLLISYTHRASLEGSAQADYRVLLPDMGDKWISSVGKIIGDGDRQSPRYIGVSIDITARKQAEAQLRELARHLQKAREDERKRLAREIHDDLGGTLTAIKFDLLSDKRREDTHPDVASLRNQDSVALIDAAIDSLRRIISDLRPSVLDDLGLWAALEWQATDFSSRTGIRCRYSLIGREIAVEPETAITLYRIVQEALTNVIRHAQASKVLIKAEVLPEQLIISIKDNGVGIGSGPVKDRPSYGLLGLHERARQLGGAVHIAGKSGRGTNIQIRVPHSSCSVSPSISP